MTEVNKIKGVKDAGGSKSALKTKRILGNAMSEGGSLRFSSAKLGADMSAAVALDRELESVKGQDFALGRIKEYLFGIEHRENTQGVGGLMLLAGAPATGKSMIGECIAKALGRPWRRFDMSGYNDKELSLCQLVGVQKSYKSATVGILTQWVLENPVCVLIFDEIEKAHANVKQLFLQILEGGVLEDKYTCKSVSFRDAIVIFTTNVGKEIYNSPSYRYNMSLVHESVIIDALGTEMNPVGEEPFFNRALVSRFAKGKVIMLNRLRPEFIHRILVEHIKGIVEYYKSIYNLSVELDLSALADQFIMAAGDGADIRGMKRMADGFFAEAISRTARLAHESGTEEYYTHARVEFDTDSDTEAARAVLGSHNAPRVLLYSSADDGIREKLLALGAYVIDGAGVREEQLEALDVSCALIDVTDSDAAGRALFDACANNDGFPIYVYSRHRSATESDFCRYVNRGAVECFRPAAGHGVIERLPEVLRCIRLSDAVEAMSRGGKVMTYELVPLYNRRTHTAIFRISSRDVCVAYRGADADTFVGREMPDVHFDEVIGAERAKEKLRELCRILSDYKKYLRGGIRIPRGIILEGEPGTGKTLLAKALACEAGLPFISKNATELQRPLVGEDSRAVRELFATARRYAPCILYIDEVDVIAKSRMGNESRYSDSLVNAFLSEMDGFNSHTGAPVCVICSTNFSVSPEDSRLDAAFLRRFDHRIKVELPNLDARVEMLSRAVGKAKESTVSEECIKALAKRSVGWNLADLSLVVENARREYELKTGSFGLDDKTLNEEFDSFFDGAKRSRSTDAVRRTAYHEAGHALVAEMLGIPVVYTTVLSRSDYGGYVLSADEEKTRYTASEILDRICKILAGRAAEVLTFGSEGINTGALSDLKSATKLALCYQCDYGMGGSLVCLPHDTALEDSELRRRVSELLDNEMARAENIIRENSDAFTRLAEALLAEGSLCEDAVKKLIYQKQ